MTIPTLEHNARERDAATTRYLNLYGRALSAPFLASETPMTREDALGDIAVGWHGALYSTSIELTISPRGEVEKCALVSLWVEAQQWARGDAA